MKDNYDFSKGIKNPYTKKLKKQITIRIDADAIEYFKEQATDVGISYQNLINLYLRDCAEKKRRLSLSWEK
ncbi:MAG TPA: BrnA antitoxin family protein [Candidatus Ornithospirochaeta avicola]|uniref:BrnA antitoxin family protein n=1 Tax=Candidatus Ornithospirochaeta avicola TaxID=2840896 RepID=A0A9D1PTH5_9SPIO|nr:BrnA antitoxin family protein [Candidatus Ornithospirochaeta avicola]